MVGSAAAFLLNVASSQAPSTSSQEALLLIGQRIDGLTVKGLRVERAQSLIELRAEGHATFEGVDATEVSAPVISTCGAFR
jgi:hypothetical protein